MSFTSEEIHSLRQALQSALPPIDVAGETLQAPAMTYVPPAHAQALDPERCVVEGIRGSGKSFWWAALSSAPHRAYLAKAFPEVPLRPDSADILQGFGTSSSTDQAPSEAVLADLQARFGDARLIWRAVVAHQLKFPKPFPQRPPVGKQWLQRVTWVQAHPEAFDVLLQQADQHLTQQGRTVLILFDALDRLAPTWPDIRPLARGLFQVALALRSTRSIRLKLFVRPDMLADEAIMGFPDASKLLARKASLLWRKVDLYALLFQCLGNADGPGAAAFRRLDSGQRPGTSARPRRTSTPWPLPADWRGNESVQEQLFTQLAGSAMSATSLKRGKPYTWLVNHLQDGADQVSPRSFCEALRVAAQITEHAHADHPLALHFKALQTGVQEASRIRVEEIKREDYPWIHGLIHPLKKLLVPCEPDEILACWNETRTLETLRQQLERSDASVKLPPQHLDEGPQGVLHDLEAIGLFERLNDGRLQMPDVYRIAFGLGRRGGVKPLR